MRKPLCFLIQYDVRCPRRLQRVYKLLKKQAYFIQNSVFIWLGNAEELDVLKVELALRINEKEDDVRAYQLHNPLLLFGSSPFLNDDVYFDGYPNYIDCPNKWLIEPPDQLWQTQNRERKEFLCSG